MFDGIDVSVGLRVSACSVRPSSVTLLGVDVVVVVGGDVVNVVVVVVDVVECVVDDGGSLVEEFRFSPEVDTSISPESRWAFPA